MSFKGAAWSAPESDGTRRAELTAAGGERLDLFVRQNRIWGTLAGGKAGVAPLSLDGARNRFAEKGDAAAQTLLNRYLGYYTVALPAYDALSLGSAGAAPLGVGYMAVTVGKGGSAKIAGVLADGTKVAQAGRLLLFDGCGPAACVPFFAPLYMKKGWAGGLLWIDPETRALETDRDIGWFIRWENPGRSGPDGFSLLLDACGGFYGTGASLASACLFGAGTEGTAWFDTLGEPWEWAALPEAVPVTAAGARLSVAKGAKPKKFSAEGDVWYEYDEVNPANVTLSFASRTGLFKGKFSLYCDSENDAGKVVHKAVSVPYAGVLTPVRGEAFDGLPAGLGHCLIPDGDPAVKAYRLKRSRPVWLEKQ